MRSASKRIAPKPIEKVTVLRQRFMIAGLSALFLSAAVSQAAKQTVEQKQTLEKARETHRYEQTKTEVGVRGMILTADGKPLARDQEAFDLQLEFKDCPRSDAFWMDLSQATGIAASEFSEAANSGANSRTWPQIVKSSQQAQVNRVKSAWRADGVSIPRSGRREYPFGENAASLVGVIRPKGLVVKLSDPENQNIDPKGIRLTKWQKMVAKFGLPPASKPYFEKDLETGIELVQDKNLQGKSGYRVGVMDKRGYFLPMRMDDSRNVAKQDGHNVVLTIESEIQMAAMQAVKKAVTDNHALSGAAVVMDPSNGNLLAIANWPSFEPYNPDGSFGSMGASADLNQAWMSCLEPGSMFKVLTLAKGLDDGTIHWNDHYRCQGVWQAFKNAKPIKCDEHRGNRAHGDLSVADVIARSCNITAAKWALDIKREPFIEYLDTMDLLQKPGLGLPGERGATFERKTNGPQVQLAMLGFGQSINISPLGMASAFASLGNGGMLHEPRLIEQIGSQVQPIQTPRRVLKPETARMVLQAMTTVFSDSRGTGKTLRIDGYSLAGKTGTAQKIGKNQSGHVSNFVGFVPASNPQALIIVMIDKPLGKYHGADVAGPVFRTIAQTVIREKAIQPDIPFKSPAEPKSKPALPNTTPRGPSIKLSVRVSRDA